MKHLLFFYLLLLPFISRSQIKDTSFAQIDQKFSQAGAEMIKFHSQYQLGIILQILGGVAVVIGSAKNASNTTTKTEPLVIVGGVLSLIGFIVNVSSTTHIKMAGILLRGNSLVIPIHKK